MVTLRTVDQRSSGACHVLADLPQTGSQVVPEVRAAYPDRPRQQDQVVALPVVVVPEVELPAARIWPGDVLHHRIGHVDDVMACQPHAQRHVGVLSQAGAGVVVMDPAQLAGDRAPERHVGAEHVVDIDDSAGMCCEMPCQAAVLAKSPDLSNACLLLAVLPVEGTTAHRCHRWSR